MQIISKKRIRNDCVEICPKTRMITKNIQQQFPQEIIHMFSCIAKVPFLSCHVTSESLREIELPDPDI